MKKKIFFLLLLSSSFAFSQKTTILKGIVKNSNDNPIENVFVKYDNTGTSTDEKGNFKLKVPYNKEITLIFSHIAYDNLITKHIVNSTNSEFLSVKLILKSESLDEIVIKDSKNEVSGIKKININTVKNVVGPNSGVENILMTLPGVNNNNELSTGYNVRGGNFDENLVYVNGIQVYRPFLIRSGQQEGFSFINPSLIKNIKFSAGGFQAKYGDRLSSVLDITYRKPKEMATSIDASLLGANITFETQIKKKITAISSFRYRDNSLFVNSKEIETNFRPKFLDFQLLLSHDTSDKLKFDFLGNFSLNNYNYKPISRITNFGTIDTPLELAVFYSGQEQDNFLTIFSAFSSEYKVNKNLTLTGIASIYNTQEEEHYDIKAEYRLNQTDADVGSETFENIDFSEGIGTQLNHARNDLDALIVNAQVKGKYKIDKLQFDFGIKYQKEDIKDRVREWEMIDSLGFSIRPPNYPNNNQPYEIFDSPIALYQSTKADNKVNITRVTGFLQFNKRAFWGENKVWYNLGVRFHNWTLKGDDISPTSKTIVSPRTQFAIKPNWNKDIIFRASLGWYFQPPSYRELRDSNGNINENLNAQKSIHFVLGMEYSFDMWNRPFKLTTDMYYKNLTSVNAYTIDNVRIRYNADNNATAYAQGFDIRLNGEFVPGTDSWFSLGYLKTEENISNRGYIPRPTDQRIKFGLLFQDYMPNLPSLKASLNLVYNTGVPGGSPSYSDVYEYKNRLRDYKRADVGVSYIIVDSNKKYSNGWLSKFDELSIGIDLFNIFDIQNSITNTWVRDVYSKFQYAVPNYMTGRILNFKLGMKF